MMNTILRGCPRLEIYNSSFTPKFSEWALGFCGGIYSKDNPGFIEQTDGSLRNVVSLDLSNRCIHSLANKVRLIFRTVWGVTLFDSVDQIYH